MIDRIRLAAEAGEGGAGIGEGVDANAEPGDAVAAGDADEAEEKNDGQREGDRFAGNGREPAEIENDDDGDEDPEEHQEFALRYEIGFAGFVDELGDFLHGAMDGEILEATIDGEAEEQAEDADEQAEEEELVAVDAEKRNFGEVGKLEIGFAARFVGFGERRGTAY